MDKLTCMRTFVGAFKSKSFTKAADALDISVALISKRVSYLESMLNVELFNRTTRSITPTADGIEYFEHCCEVLSKIDNFEDSINIRNRLLKGIIKVSVPLAFGLVYLRDFVPYFHSKYPEIHIQLDLNDGFVGFSENQNDIILRISNDLPDSGLIAKQIFEIERVAVASPDFCEKNRLVEPSDLSKVNCLLYRNNKSYDSWTFSKLEEKTSVVVSGNLISNNGEILKSSAIKGFGVVLGPKFIVQEELNNHLLMRVLSDYQLESKFLYALYSIRLKKSNNIKIFIDELMRFCNNR